MTEDYLIFGAGYNGELREFDECLDEIEIITKPSMFANQSIVHPAKPLEFIRLRVNTLSVDGHRYNVASSGIPGDEELRIAVMRERPRPVPAR